MPLLLRTPIASGHSQRLRKLIKYKQFDISDQHIRNARRAYYGMIRSVAGQGAQRRTGGADLGVGVRDGMRAPAMWTTRSAN